MTTGFGQSTGLDAAAFDTLIGDAVRGESVRGRTAASASAPHVAAESTSVAAAVGTAPSALAQAARVPIPALGADGTPGAAEVARQLGHSLRTAAPLLAADVVALAACGLAAEGLTRLLWPGAASAAAASPAATATAAFALLAVVVGHWLTGLYAEVWIHPSLELRQSTQVTTVALLAAALAGAWARPVALWCVLAWPLAVVLLPRCRVAARHCCAGRTWWGFPTLVIGRGNQAEAVARMLMRARQSGLRPALLSDPEGEARASIIPVVNDVMDLRSLVRAKGIRHAVLCLTDLPGASLGQVLDQYAAFAPHLLVVCENPPLPTLWGAQRVCGLGGVEVRNGLLLVSYRAFKRATDVLMATAALTAGLPLLLAIAAMVKLSSTGPVLFGHTRIGRYGRRFTAWKFRTMRPGAGTLLRQHFEQFPAAREEWERDQKLRDDPRVTRVGRVLRRLSLDELPQMWNVLVGQMSVVGPRPIVDDEVVKYGDAFELYAGVRPGITGLWQVSGRTDVGYGMRVRLDEFYVRHWSPWLDAYLLVRTVVALVRHRGAY
jgi:Undecaprenyl-phosphate galactose phosphotransferase WbaP